MGYLAKHIKVQRYKRNLRMIAHASLAGAVIERQRTARSHFLDGILDLYVVHYPDGQHSQAFTSRGKAAVRYLFWWTNKQGMWP